MQPVHTPEPKVANGGGGAGDGGGGGGGEGGGEKMTLLMESLSLLIPFRLTWISPLLTVSFWSSGERGCWKMPAVEVEPLLRRYCSEPKPSAGCAHARSSSRPRRPQGGATPEDGAGMAGRGAGQIAGAERGQLRSLFAEAAAALLALSVPARCTMQKSYLSNNIFPFHTQQGRYEGSIPIERASKTD